MLNSTTRCFSIPKTGALFLSLLSSQLNIPNRVFFLPQSLPPLSKLFCTAAAALTLLQLRLSLSPFFSPGTQRRRLTAAHSLSRPCLSSLLHLSLGLAATCYHPLSRSRRSGLRAARFLSLPRHCPLSFSLLLLGLCCSPPSTACPLFSLSVQLSLSNSGRRLLLPRPASIPVAAAGIPASDRHCSQARRFQQQPPSPIFS